MTDRELILYACPAGPLGEDLDRYFEEATRRFGPTAAQTYPVHCTLTGFFRRSPDRADEVLARLGAILAEIGPPPPDSIAVEGLGVHDAWVGLELDSAWLLELIETVVAADVTIDGEDALRAKDWLHVSLAYGVDDVAGYAKLARETVDPTRSATWSVGLWERHVNGTWTAH